MIQCAQAPLGGGKTFQTAKRSAQNIHNGLTTLIFQPTHAAGREVLGMIKSHNLGLGYALSLRGKSKETCLPKNIQKQCKRCPIFKDSFINKDEQMRLTDIAMGMAAGKVLELGELKQLAEDLKICVLLLTRILSFAKGCKKIIVAPYAYLATSVSMDIIENIEIDEIIGDEADKLFDDLVTNQQRKITIALPRKNKNSVINDRCDKDCVRCRIHFSDRSETGLRPSGGRVESLEGISNILNTVELVENAIADIQQAIDDGILRIIINLVEIRSFIGKIVEILPAVDENVSPYDFVQKIYSKNDKNKISFGGRLDDLEDGQFAIPIEIGAVVSQTINTEDLFESELPDEKMRVHQMLANMFIAEEPNKVDFKRLEKPLKLILSLVDFLQDAKGIVYLVPERRGRNNFGFDHCSLRLRYLKTDHYERVLKFLSGRSRLISGTMGTVETISANLLTTPDQIKLHVAPVSMHDSALIVVHNSGDKQTPFVADFPPWAVKVLYLKIQKRIQNLRVLHFAINSKTAKHSFDSFCDSEDLTTKFAIELTDKNSVVHDMAGAFEHHQDRPAMICIDKLRSSTSRAVNRNLFDLCTVFGNGVANWDSRITLALAVAEKGLNVTLEDLIEEEQVRTVTQALMRAPRGMERTACFYVGNLQPLSFPKFLHNRIVTTREIIATHLRRTGSSAAEFESIESQINLIVEAFLQFLVGEDVIVTIERSVAVDPIRLKWKGRSDAYDGRMEHIWKCIFEKGFVDQVVDKKGERQDWKSFLSFLIAEGVLKEETRGRKVVFVKAN